MYWQYKYYNDLTTCTPSGESLFNNDGTPATHKLDTLTRPYPGAVAGSIGDYGFDPKTSIFHLTYSVSTLGPTATEEARTTVVRLNPAMHYPNGVRVAIAGSAAAAVKFACASGPASISLIQREGEGEGGTVELTVLPCGGAAVDAASCSCTFKQ